MVVGDPNGIWVLSLRRFVLEELGYKAWGDFSLIALYYGKIFVAVKRETCRPLPHFIAHTDVHGHMGLGAQGF